MYTALQQLCLKSSPHFVGDLGRYARLFYASHLIPARVKLVVTLQLLHPAEAVETIWNSPQVVTARTISSPTISLKRQKNTRSQDFIGYSVSCFLAFGCIH